MPIALDNDFDDVPAMRREIQRLNDKIDRMHDEHFDQCHRLITRCHDMANWIANSANASDEKAGKAVDDTLGDKTWRKLPNRMT